MNKECLLGRDIFAYFPLFSPLPPLFSPILVFLVESPPSATYRVLTVNPTIDLVVKNAWKLGQDGDNDWKMSPAGKWTE